jgi:hypothetical protein
VPYSTKARCFGGYNSRSVKPSSIVLKTDPHHFHIFVAEYFSEITPSRLIVMFPKFNVAPYWATCPLATELGAAGHRSVLLGFNCPDTVRRFHKTSPANSSRAAVVVCTRIKRRGKAR